MLAGDMALPTSPWQARHFSSASLALLAQALPTSGASTANFWRKHCQLLAQALPTSGASTANCCAGQPNPSTSTLIPEGTVLAHVALSIALQTRSSLGLGRVGLSLAHTAPYTVSFCAPDGYATFLSSITVACLPCQARASILSWLDISAVLRTQSG